MKIKLKCPKCGGSAIFADAYARWNVETQNWELHDVYDDRTCNDCGGDTKPIEVEIKDPTREDLKFNSIWTYKNAFYQVNTLMERNLTQDPETGEWQPTVRYTTYPQNGLVFYRADTEFIRKFSPLKESLTFMLGE